MITKLNESEAEENVAQPTDDMTNIRDIAEAAANEELDVNEAYNEI